MESLEKIPGPQIQRFVQMFIKEYAINTVNFQCLDLWLVHVIMHGQFLSVIAVNNIIFIVNAVSLFSVLEQIRAVAGNDKCADCGSPG